MALTRGEAPLADALVAQIDRPVVADPAIDLLAVRTAPSSLSFAAPRVAARRTMGGSAMTDPIDTLQAYYAARALERVPELAGLGPHLLATARRPR